jgi:hypothetical protein
MSCRKIAGGGDKGKNYSLSLNKKRSGGLHWAQGCGKSYLRGRQKTPATKSKGNA